MSDERSGRERLPLSFPDWDTYRRFQNALRARFHSEKIVDAVVQQIGSPCTGWEMAPTKPMAPWTQNAPVELVIFSSQSLEQAQAAVLEVDRSVIYQGKYVQLLARTGTAGRGLDATPIGRKLAALGTYWTSVLPGHPEVRFSLCLATKPFADGPFEGAIVVLAPAVH